MEESSSRLTADQLVLYIARNGIVIKDAVLVLLAALLLSHKIDSAQLELARADWKHPLLMHVVDQVIYPLQYTAQGSDYAFQLYEELRGGRLPTASLLYEQINNVPTTQDMKDCLKTAARLIALLAAAARNQ